MVDRGRTVHAPNGMVCSVDHLASAAGVGILQAGGTAADAAVAASAVLAVTTQHMCGMGGDLLALVHDGSGGPEALISAGRAGAGSDPHALRAEGHLSMPRRGDVRTATVPGCVDGWLALHERYGRLPLAIVLGPARGYAAEGFPAAPLLTAATVLIAELDGAEDYRPRSGRLRTGDRVRRPLVADALAAVIEGGRHGFYGGPFGAGLLELGRGLFTAADLDRNQAEWTSPLVVRAWGHDVWTTPPPSQGYLSLAAAWVADGLDLPDDPDDRRWAHLLSETARAVGHDRPAVLFDGADGAGLLGDDRLEAQRALVDPAGRGAPSSPSEDGGTIYLCAVDRDGMGVSLIQSNAADWGAHLVVPGTGIFLHNRGLGFSLEPGHPAELTPGRRPPHTLSPALVTHPDGRLAAVLGTMGGDIQPQVVLQLLARLLRNAQSPGWAIGAPRWTLGDGGFTTWDPPGPEATRLEDGSPWGPGLRALGHHVVEAPADTNVGHAHAIVIGPDGMRAGAADPRALTGAAFGH